MVKRILVVVAGLCCFFVGNAQSIESELIRQPSVKNPAVAINRKDPRNIVVVAHPNHLFVTFDGGTTWESTAIQSAAVRSDITVTSTTKGVFYCFYMGGQSDSPYTYPVVQQSADGGRSWSDPTTIAEVSGSFNNGLNAVAGPKDELMVTWLQFDQHPSGADASCKSRVLFSTSANGKKWTAPKQLSGIEGDCTPVGSVANSFPVQTLDGKILSTWTQGNTIFLDRSFDGGSLWLRGDIDIVTISSGWTLTETGYEMATARPVFAADVSRGRFRNSLYLSWSDEHETASDADVWFSTSINYGDNWSSPLKVSTGTPGSQQIAPWIAIDPATGYIYIAYLDQGEHQDGLYDLTLSHSEDTKQFSSRSVNQEAFNLPFPGGALERVVSLDAFQGRIVIAWMLSEGAENALKAVVIVPETADKKKK